MRPRVQAAVEALIAVLEQENAALLALDPVRAGACLPAKQAAMEELALAEPMAADTAMMMPAAARLRDLAAENRRLLERAILVQNRVIGVVARAAPGPAMMPRYAANGVLAKAARPVPMALSARA